MGHGEKGEADGGRLLLSSGDAWDPTAAGGSVIISAGAGLSDDIVDGGDGGSATINGGYAAAGF